jgi:hypothetical protein
LSPNWAWALATWIARELEEALALLADDFDVAVLEAEGLSAEELHEECGGRAVVRAAQAAVGGDDERELLPWLLPAESSGWEISPPTVAESSLDEGEEGLGVGLAGDGCLLWRPRTCWWRSSASFW